MMSSVDAALFYSNIVLWGKLYYSQSTLLVAHLDTFEEDKRNCWPCIIAQSSLCRDFSSINSIFYLSPSVNCLFKFNFAKAGLSLWRHEFNVHACLLLLISSFESKLRVHWYICISTPNIRYKLYFCVSVLTNRVRILRYRNSTTFVYLRTELK